MTGWQYRTHRTTHPDETWARELAAQGWQTWAPGSGVWLDMTGVRTFLVALRRPCQRAGVHDHDRVCREVPTTLDLGGNDP